MADVDGCPANRIGNEAVTPPSGAPMTNAGPFATAAGPKVPAPSTGGQEEDLAKLPISKILGRLTPGQLYAVLASLAGLIAGAFGLGYWVRDLRTAPPKACNLVRVLANGAPLALDRPTPIAEDIANFEWEPAECVLTAQVYDMDGKIFLTRANASSGLPVPLPRAGRYELKLADDRAGRGYIRFHLIERTATASPQ